MILLRRPTLADKDAVIEMIREFQEEESDTAGLWDFTEGSSGYQDWLEATQAREMGLLRIPAIQFLAFRGDYPIGFLSLRLRLTDALLQKGGHIGYSVRPSERGRGYAKAMLEQGICAAISKNIHRILVTCHQENHASRAVIVANGGVLEDVREGTERYWIEV